LSCIPGKYLLPIYYVKKGSRIDCRVLLHTSVTAQCMWNFRLCTKGIAQTIHMNINVAWFIFLDFLVSSRFFSLACLFYSSTSNSLLPYWGKKSQNIIERFHIRSQLTTWVLKACFPKFKNLCQCRINIQSVFLTCAFLIEKW
jgi:hypothetical protein